MSRKVKVRGLRGRKRNACADRQGMRAWYARKLGQWLLEAERGQLEEVLPNLFGYHLVQVGRLVDDDLLAASRVPHRVIVDVDGEAGKEGEEAPSPPRPGLVGKPDSLPLQRDAIDVVVLHHALEFENNPHEVLREVDRVLIAEGHVVIVGFNPWSIWGLWRLLRFRRRSTPPWCGTFRSMMRLNDWLALLGFDTIYSQTCFFRPPSQRPGIMDKLTFLESLGRRWCPILGGAYVLVAKKRVVTLTPIKPRWRTRRRFIEADVT